MLKAIEPGTVIPIHRHTGTSEDVVILRGKAEEVFFDIRWIEIGQWHTVRVLESGSVILEMKEWAYEPIDLKIL